MNPNIIEHDVIKEDGSLYSLGWYLCWHRGMNTANLDGPFTAEELRAIADHMDKHMRGEGTAPEPGKAES